MLKNNDEDAAYRLAYTREKLARLEAERLLEDRSRELYQRNCELEESCAALKQQQSLALYHEKMATLGMLASAIASQINSPLASILSNVHLLPAQFVAMDRLLQLNISMLASDSLPEALRQQLSALLSREALPEIALELPVMLNEIEDGLGRIRGIVAGLDHYSRTADEVRETADLVEVLREVIDLLGSEIPPELQLTVDCPDSAPLCCRPVALSQVFINLMLNALQAVAERDNPAIEVAVAVRGNGWSVRIADNGCGIAGVHLKKVCLPFFTTKMRGKAGMGLAVAQRILFDHGGAMDIESTEGAGAVFEVYLPGRIT